MSNDILLKLEDPRLKEFSYRVRFLTKFLDYLSKLADDVH